MHPIVESRAIPRRGSARPILIALVALLLVAIGVVWKLGAGGGADVALPPAAKTTEKPAPKPAEEKTQEAPALVAGTAPSASPAARETVADPSPSASPRPGSALGTLAVTLTDGKAPVPGGTVRLVDPKNDEPRVASITEGSRVATFTDLAPGSYRVLVDHLPDGWLPPRILTRNGPRDFIETNVRAGANALELALEPSVRVFGKVFGADGEPVDGIHVRFATLEGEWGRRSGSFDFPVRAGSYEGGVYDGVWAVTPRDRYEHAGETETIPVPEVRRLAPGSATEVDFTFERGTGGLAGRVLDESGQPFAGVEIYGLRLVPVKEPASGQGFQLPQWIGRDTSNEDGTFLLPSLAAGHYRVLVDAGGYSPVAAPGQNKIGAEVAPVEVDVVAAGTARADLTVPRSRLVRVHGSVVVDPAWASAADAVGKIPTIHLIVGPIRDGAMNTRHRIDGGDGKFDFLVEAAAAEPRLEISLGMERTTVPLVLAKDAELPPLLLHFPK